MYDIKDKVIVRLIPGSIVNGCVLEVDTVAVVRVEDREEWHEDMVRGGYLYYVQAVSVRSGAHFVLQQFFWIGEMDIIDAQNVL